MCNTPKKSYYTCDVTRVQSSTQWTASVHTLHTLHTSRNLGWGGVGRNDMHCTCTHIRCYAIALAHMFDATQLHLRTCSMLRNCTCAHVRCYAIAFAHIPYILPQTKEANKKKGKGMFADVRELLEERVKQWTWRAELLRVNPHLSKQQFLKHLAKVC